ncbi:Lrp/AsnC family transcriptional regulator [Ideonella sp. 4Y11]|uniref:siroheme decarboxylase n=1 Tax=Ideonella aquatica TaxID=2824119 RepID=A0A940YLC8_9BURK|nr:Lrp/AsnC family transcriptional regulator [Ideonella aquatica]MBQ0960096.1 Lrp/AsnC family transcriptional regulator [Ideonella aquatica]
MDRLSLLNAWQRGLPLTERPFDTLATVHGCSVPALLAELRSAQQAGQLSRVGGVFAASAGGAALLAAMAVPEARLDAVAAIVSAHPGVNHNYAREHAHNLWFVMTGVDAAAVERSMQALEAATSLPALRLPLRRPYRIDLGFDLRRSTAGTAPGERRLRAPAVADHDRALAALVEDGLPLIERPFNAWAQALGWRTERVLQVLARWLDQGTLRRFGLIVRHHEFGFTHNAMAVFDVPDTQVDVLGPRLAAQPGITLCYRRERAGGWPYNLYGMVHGRDRDSVRAVLASATAAAGLDGLSQQVLFSWRRYKQTGARRFRDLPVMETDHAHAG